MTKIIHKKIVIQTELVAIDDDGNAIGESQVSQQVIYKLTLAEFEIAYNQIVEHKEKLEHANSDTSN